VARHHWNDFAIGVLAAPTDMLWSSHSRQSAVGQNQPKVAVSPIAKDYPCNTASRNIT